MNTILGFKNLEDEDLEEHPCSNSLRDNMSEFHDSLLQVVSISSMEEDDGGDMGDQDEASGKPSVWRAIVQVDMKESSSCKMRRSCFYLE